MKLTNDFHKDSHKDFHKDFEISEMRGSASQACTMLRTLANEDRLLVLCQLIEGPRTVGELESLLGIHQPTLSQQLTVLRQEGLVSTERKGKYIIYSLASGEVVQIMQTLYQLYCGSKHMDREGEKAGKATRPQKKDADRVTTETDPSKSSSESF